MVVNAVYRLLLYKSNVGKIPTDVFGSGTLTLGKSIGFVYDTSILSTIGKVKLVYGIKKMPVVYFPPNYLDELIGLSETTGELLGYFKTLQLVPDLSHYAGCTTLVGRNPIGDVIMFRHMDWIPYGNTAPELVRLRIGSITIFTIPGMMGAVTGYNVHGLVLAMNTSPCESYTGMPSIYFNRMILEKCKNVEEAIRFINEVFDDDANINHRPFRAYHLTIASANDFARISFYHARGWKPLIIRSKDTVLTQSNEAHTENSNGIIDTYNFCEPSRKHGTLLSDTRSNIVDAFFRRNEFTENNLVELAKLRPINNHITCQSYIFNVTKQTFSAAFDNGFAGDANRYDYTFR